MDQQNNLNPITPKQTVAPTVEQAPMQAPPQPPVIPTSAPQVEASQYEPQAGYQPQASGYPPMQQPTYAPTQPQYQPYTQEYPQGYQPTAYAPQPQQYHPYAPMQYQMMPIEQEPPKNGLSVAALVTGILGLTSCTPFPCSILALIFGIIGYRANRKGTALAGIVLGAIGVSMLAFFVFIVIMASLDEGYLNDYSEFARILSSLLR